MTLNHADRFEKPIDWMAAGGLTSSLIPDPGPFIEVSSNTIKKLAKVMKKETGKPHNVCMNEVAQNYGYDHFSHYVDMMKQRGEFRNHAELLQKKKARNSARKQALAYAEMIEGKKVPG